MKYCCSGILPMTKLLILLLELLSCRPNNSLFGYTEGSSRIHGENPRGSFEVYYGLMYGKFRTNYSFHLSAHLFTISKHKKQP